MGLLNREEGESNGGRKGREEGGRGGEWATSEYSILVMYQPAELNNNNSEKCVPLPGIFLSASFAVSRSLKSDSPVDSPVGLSEHIQKS